MAAVNALETADDHFLMGESLRPLLTHAMGSCIEIFDTSGPAGSGPPPHAHAWEEIHVVLEGELEVTVDGETLVNSDGVLSLRDIPQSLTVVGAGVVGTEYASMFAALGTHVELIDRRNRLLPFVDDQIIEALATHPEKKVRAQAFQVLVLDNPVPDYQQYLPAFIESGRPFLDEESIRAISGASIGPRRLQAFRQRLYSYRTQLTWPAPERTRLLFADIFRLLADFGRFHPEFYGPIREELVTWVLHEEDPDLAAAARRELEDLVAGFEQRLDRACTGLDPAAWDGKIVFQEGLGVEEVQRLRKVLIGTSFLKQSVMLAFEGEDLVLDDIGPGGIWVSRIISRYHDSRYRVSINTLGGKHFDLQVLIREDDDPELVENTIFRYIQLRGYPFRTPMLPNFGCSRPELGALSMAYISDLTVWEKIREFSSVRGPGTTPPTRMRWHQLMVRAMAVVIRGWRNSGRQIIPGLIMPNNIIVPEPDFRKGAVQNSLSGFDVAPIRSYVETRNIEINDSIEWGDWTFNLGLRWERQEQKNDVDERVYIWQDLPRLAADVTDADLEERIRAQ